QVDASKVERRQIMGDERRLKQALINILSNAVKYNRVGGKVTVHCAIAERESRGECLLLRVADTGRGLSSEQMKGLFEPFNRLGADRDGIEGTGLGLVITRRLIESMGGEITVDSTEGVGTTVTVAMPLMVQASTAAAPTEPDAARLQQGDDRATTVLCIEDNPLNAALLRAIFDLRPHVKLLIAEDGEKGLDRLQHAWPDLVLIDINLPDMNGGEVLARIRQMPQGQGVTCIAMSADVSRDPVSRAREQGFADFWPKPLDVSGVLMRLDAVLASVKPDQARRRGEGVTA
ncbi:MAG: response regulator, partial [Aquabacterium sp.]|nr:response regulator [Aquabacterium sp.]